MATTTVTLNDEMGMCVPSVSSVPLQVGAQIVFTTAESVSAILYFSPSAAAILAPDASAPVPLASGQPVTFTVTSAGADTYGVITSLPWQGPPESFYFGDPQTPPVLSIMPGGLSFSVAAHPPKT